MPIRKEGIFEGEYYHVFNRGINKQQIFFDKRDYARFLFYILFFQSPLTVFNIGRRVTDFLKIGDFNVAPEIIEEIINQRYTELINFSFMPNHIHLILKESQEGGISKIMQRGLAGFTNYTNTKYKKSGHIFQGPFRAVHVTDNTQLLHLSSYVHKNLKELKGWQNQWEHYPWSSYQDFVGNNRWGPLLSRDIILSQFKNPEEYAQFVKTSTAKEILDNELLLDF